MLCRLLGHKWRIVNMYFAPNAPYYGNGWCWWTERKCVRCGLVEERDSP